MTPYSLMELGIALLCAFLAALHLALWRAAPKERVHLALVASMSGFALMNLGFAGSSGSAAGTLGWSVPFLVLSFVGLVPCWLGGAFLVWALADRKCVGPRRVYVGFLLAGALYTITKDVVWLSHLDSAAPTWEQMARNPADPLDFVPALCGGSLAILALVEGVLALVQRRRNGVLLLLPGIPGAVIVAIENWNQSRQSDAPTLIGLIGLPLILVASLAMIFRYGAAMKSQEFAGGYRLIRRLGSGGMGELFLATRSGIGGFERPVALKRVRPSREIDARAIESLLDEARLSAKLVHPNIVAVQDVGRLDDENGKEGFGFFLAMEWLPGVDLIRLRDAAAQRRTLLPPDPIASIAQQVCRGLAHAHAAGIVHRDVSPHNVMVTFDGAVKIVHRALATKIEDRFPSAEAFGDALAGWLRDRPPSDPGALARELCPDEVKLQRELFADPILAADTAALPREPSTRQL